MITLWERTVLEVDIIMQSLCSSFFAITLLDYIIIIIIIICWIIHGLSFFLHKMRYKWREPAH